MKIFMKSIVHLKVLMQTITQLNIFQICKTLKHTNYNYI